MKSAILTSLYFLQSTLLLAAGCFTLWQTESLMIWFISIIGEEFALGEENVVRLDGGGTLLTNPGAMICWTIPFILLGFIQISSAITLIYQMYAANRRAN